MLVEPDLRPAGADVRPARRHRRPTRWLAVVAVAVGIGASACLGQVPSGPPPPVNPGAATAVAYATEQLGKPYCTGGAGPSCFDCSGLTMQAWGAGGLALPHFSGSQYAMFPKIALSQLQPGDLVFPPDPNQHVGLYIGNGNMIHATTPGDVVKVASISVVGMTLAVRPG